ncbi:UNVERIFIED_CONTAM: hypothetical protein Slati_2211800 [Sesamum latifolium]|uniref:Endonuclease/exonuclease/phosphatase domain-containing protein n=1 Tax=Sesamum latifolium TaxID=2727402 RepID=A0AAW2WUF0_9LAMI
MIRAASWNVRGLNRRDHQTAVRDLISEFSLLFVGLVDTRVAAQHVSRVQEAVLQHWKWFNAPNEAGNRIWLTWDDSEIDVVILEVHEQCIHSRVCMKRTLDACLITVVYRMLANDSWLARWPESVCLSSTPRTSDHSPLILRGHAMHRSGVYFASTISSGCPEFYGRCE